MQPILLSLAGLSALAVLVLTLHRSPEDPRTPNPTGSPVSLDELRELKEVLLFGPEDEAALRRSAAILEPRVEEVLDVWYGFVASTPQLVKYFAKGKDNPPDGAYLAAVRVRFAQWIRDTAAANYNQEWLDFQHEIGLRHHSAKKNRTDGVDAAPIIHQRYLVALAYPVTHTLRPFLEAEGVSPAEVETMHQAWTKAVLLSVILWSAPYVREGEF